jgi:hypothetical protein
VWEIRINSPEEILAFTSPENGGSIFPSNIGAYFSSYMMSCLLKP